MHRERYICTNFVQFSVTAKTTIDFGFYFLLFSVRPWSDESLKEAIRMAKVHGSYYNIEQILRM